MTPKLSARRDAARRLAEYKLAAYQRRERPREKGQVLIIFALAIVVIMLFASIVLDLGLLRNNRQILVNAVDAGALAGGTLLPVDGCSDSPTQSATDGCANHGGTGQANYQAVIDLIDKTVQSTYPGISTSNYTISFRCLIGVTDDTPPVPYVSRDVPIVCNPRRGGLSATPVADHNVTAADFKGTGVTRYANCFPDLGDRCNVVVISGVTSTNYSFGRVVGINQGSTGTVVSAACNGPCGQPPSAPVDLVVLLDRTASMSSSQIADARNALRAVLQVYDPALQRVALGFLGPSWTNQTCSGTGGGPAVAVKAIDNNSPSAPTLAATATAVSNATAGAGTLVLNKPTGVANTNVLVAAIAVQGGTNITVTAPAGWSQILRTNNGTNLSLISYRKVITNSGSEPATYTWTLSPNARASGNVMRYTGVDNTTPVNISGGGTGNDTSSPFQPSAPTVATTRDDVELIAFTAILNGSGGTATNFFGTWTNSMNERWDVRGTNAVGPSIAAASKTDTTAGNSNATTSNATAGGQWAAQHVALNPDFSNHYGTTYPDDLLKWIPIGFSGTDTDSPAQTYNEAYVDSAGTLQNGTHIVSAINCFNNPGGTGTNLTTPIEMAAAYLQNFGRPNVKWGILFETDGEPSYSSTGDPGNYTCASAVAAANAAKAITNADGKHIEVFTVGFLDSTTGDPNCPDGSGTYATHGVTKALKDMASSDLAPSSDGEGGNDCTDAENTDQDHFFCEPDSTELETVFQTIASEFAGVRSHMIQLCPAPSVTSVSPSSGTRTGNTLVTITGKYFTGTTSVKFGGTNGTSLTVASDTSITVRTPAGTAGQTVSVTVTGDPDCGSSLPHSGSTFTYT